MDESTFNKKLGELMSQIDSLPAEERDRLRSLAAETKQRHADIRKSVDQMQENIDFLRLWIKYMLFDLEATRRENAYLRKMLEEDTNNNNNNNESQ
jgi:hypothetical protein